MHSVCASRQGQVRRLLIEHCRSSRSTTVTNDQTRLSSSHPWCNSPPRFHTNKPDALHRWETAHTSPWRTSATRRAEVGGVFYTPTTLHLRLAVRAHLL